MTLALGVLASGRGSNLQAIIDRIKEGKLEAQIRMVASDNPKAQALKRAEKENIKTLILDGETMAKEEMEDIIIKTFKEEGIKLVVLAGFMRILGPTFISSFRYRIINIHPSLLPAFPGLEAQKQALDYGVKVSGCTVHFVDEEMDAGPIILQAAIPIQETDTPQDLSRRILEKEHALLPAAIQLLAQDRLYLEGRTVKIRREVVS